ncbi:MAG: hypothetical protein RML72_06090 [Bacteroidia bacterium]|nr:hypothetical protein [Bacteroidia bacterium]MDW8158430.1 hypothetical protein [Bacteroidia bacterium]
MATIIPKQNKNLKEMSCFSNGEKNELVLVTGAEIEEYLKNLKDEDQALARFIINHRFKGKILPEGLYLHNEWEQVKELISYLLKLT